MVATPLRTCGLQDALGGLEDVLRISAGRNRQNNAASAPVRLDLPGIDIVEGMVVLSRPGRMLDVGDVPEHLRRTATPDIAEIRIPTGTPMKDIERIAIEETMKVCGYNKEACAKMLGIGLRTLYRKLKEYDL